MGKLSGIAALVTLVCAGCAVTAPVAVVSKDIPAGFQHSVRNPAGGSDGTTSSRRSRSCVATFKLVALRSGIQGAPFGRM